jgi:hypothetical protein
MTRSIIRCTGALSVLGAVSLTGCAMMGSMRPAADSYTFDVGVGSANEIRARTGAILKELGYQAVRDDGSENVHIETDWQKRLPVDERERSLRTEIISRVSIAGEQNLSAGVPGTYHVLVTIESRFVPTQGMQRDAHSMVSSMSYAQSIVKGMSLAFGGTARPVADEPRPF